MRKLLTIAYLIFLAGCTDPKGAIKVLLDAGITPSNVGGYSWFGCSDSDTYATKFRGVNAQGRAVSGVVCAGMFFKNSTVRFD